MKRHTCSALDENGHRCRRRATIESHYFGDPELRPRWPQWVRVWWCDTHDPDGVALDRQRTQRGLPSLRRKRKVHP